MRFSSTLKAGVAFGLLTAVTATAAFAAPNLKPVYDSNGNFVIDSNSNCVRTNWETGHDYCGKAAPVAKAAPAPAPILETLHKEETIVYFDFDKSNLTSQSQEKLTRLAGLLKGHEEIIDAKIVGYADPVGTPAYNQKLSERRASAVKTYLDEKGFKGSEVADVQALGETDAFARCVGVKPRAKLLECNWKNRRVEVKLNYKEKQQQAEATPAN